MAKHVAGKKYKLSRPALLRNFQSGKKIKREKSDEQTNLSGTIRQFSHYTAPWKQKKKKTNDGGKSLNTA